MGRAEAAAFAWRRQRRGLCPRSEPERLFILFYCKRYPLQGVAAFLFGMSQRQVSGWVGQLASLVKAVLTELRRLPTTAHTPVLMLSVDATPHSRERLLSLGANGHVSKPFNVPELLARLAALLPSTPGL